MSEESPREHHPPSTPSDSATTPSRTRSPSPAHGVERQEQSDERVDGQSGSAPPPVVAHTPHESENASAAIPSAHPSKSKSAKHRKSRSPSPLPVVQPPPLQTIRLEIKLGGPSHYEVDIAALALETGQGALTPPIPPKPDTSDSEEETDHAPLPTTTALKKGKRRVCAYKKNVTSPSCRLLISCHTFFFSSFPFLFSLGFSSHRLVIRNTT